jgi:hypothetical protein
MRHCESLRSKHRGGDRRTVVRAFQYLDGVEFP